ncbi:ribonuclease domain-containing protein [Cognatazoarcus halotolerans]|uniref:ribonuclease domain-containing protein n=1 Tax=Cognatazoarcus halotolerans TaxID=2686016 RepID=UPI0013578D15|nr:ribonuclease domain-containing protein [Cognatazoarcus halotolerans]
MLQRLLVLLAVILAISGCGPQNAPSPASHAASAQPVPIRHDAGLPQEVLETLHLIRAGGPFPYRKDGAVFQNREKRLPHMPRGYYREYTVPTPGARDRGARRIVAGGNPPEVYYYTSDHYRSFKRISP